MIGQGFRRDAESFFFDDFHSYNTTTWPTLTNDGSSGTVAVSETAGSANGGQLKIPTAAAANDYQLLSTKKVFEFVAGKPVIVEAKFKITDAGTNSSHWCFGLTDTVTTGWLTDTTGAPPSSYSGAMVWKPTGAATVKCETANGSTKNTNSSAFTFVSGTPIHIAIAFDPGDGVTGYVQFLFNQQGTDASFNKIPRIPVTLSGLNPMCISLGIKASGSNVETLFVDWVTAKAYR